MRLPQCLCSAAIPLLVAVVLGCGPGGADSARTPEPTAPRVQKGLLVKRYPKETTNLEQLRATWSRAKGPGQLQCQTNESINPVPALVDRNQTSSSAANWVSSHGIQYTSSDDLDHPRVYSGRVYLPTFWTSGPRKVPLVVYAHGTEVERDAVPFFNRGVESALGALSAYLCGFVVAMPDLPGMGLDASHRPHHYCHAKALANCVLDMVHPALKSLEGENLEWDGRLFLVGYSEGGYATMAAVRELQTNPEYRGLTLTGSACMSGPFDFSGSARKLLSDASTPFSRPYIQTYLVNAYHDLYGHSNLFHPDRVLNPLLLEHRNRGALDDGNIHSWMNGSLNGEAITPKIQLRLKGHPEAPLTAREVLNPCWVEEHLLHESWPDTPVGRILKANDLVGGWVPTAPMLLASSPTDECVPGDNTIKIMEAWRQMNCRAQVEHYPLVSFSGAGMDHVTGGKWALVKAFRWIYFGSWGTPEQPAS